LTEVYEGQCFALGYGLKLTPL